jgi:16S rRNA (cytidine1402-2'-O)-methyltransferase
MNAGLYLVGTPIGNLDDISARALTTLKEVDAILTEDTRHTRILLDRFGIEKPVYSCHKFNEASKADDIVRRIQSGQALALVTDSGMPGISDPGSRMVTACRLAGVSVKAIPGPSAVTTAVALSGFVSNGFVFAGFAPRKRGAMCRLLEEVRHVPLPVVIFESPYRLVKLMEVVEEVLADRQLFVGRELTKKFEETLWGTAVQVRKAFDKRTVKGELVVVIAPCVDS